MEDTFYEQKKLLNGSECYVVFAIQTYIQEVVDHFNQFNAERFYRAVLEEAVSYLDKKGKQ